MDKPLIREIEPGDNTQIASIIRNTLREFGLERPGTAYFDSSLDTMYENFKIMGSRYLVALTNNTIVGGGGIFPSPGLTAATCELVKMYLVPEVRGKGLGQCLLGTALDLAQSLGYRRLYLETFPELRAAMSLYESVGFQYLEGPMGNTGHYSCSIWMLKEL